jgi:hypothetical protein
MKLFGFIPVRWIGEGKKIKDRSINYVQTSGLLKGLTADWEFIEINPVLTKVQIILSFNSCFIFSLFLRYFLTNTSQQLLKDLKIAISGER